MYSIFFWILMLLTLLGGGYAYRGAWWPAGGYSLLVWVLILLLGLKAYPFHG